MGMLEAFPAIAFAGINKLMQLNKESWTEETLEKWKMLMSVDCILSHAQKQQS